MSEPGTPLPWKWVHTKTKRGLQLPLRISDETDGKWVAHACNVYDDGHLDYIDVGEQDAVYIVEACNAYPKLVQALRECVAAITEGSAPQLALAALYAQELLKKEGE